jgi:glycosyltransferase involved in cell wall biosynthesis
MRSFRKWVADINPDVIHSHTFRADVSSIKHLSSYRRIATIHADLHANYTDTYGTIVGTLFARKQIESIKRMDRAIACSKSVYELYEKEIDNITYIQNGIDQEYFNPVRDKAGLRTKLSLPVGQKLFISAGSLIKRKNPEAIIEAFLLREKPEDSSLVMLGSGVLEKQLRQKYEGENGIIFKGFIPDVTPYMQCSDFFVSASSSEGLPNTVMEALGCGLPVCLSDIPSHREILELNPRAGRLFSLSSKNELVEGINSLVGSSDTGVGEAALGIVRDRLNANYMAQQYQEIYLNVARHAVPG